MTQPTEQTMEERFDELFSPGSLYDTEVTCDTDSLKAFIRSEIQAAIQADREGMVKRLKGMKYGENEKIHGRWLHNETIDEAITLIKAKKV